MIGKDVTEIWNDCGVTLGEAMKIFSEKRGSPLTLTEEKEVFEYHSTFGAWERRGKLVFGGFKPFISPLDGKEVRNVKELKEHNARYAVIDVGNEFSKNKAKRKEKWDARKEENKRVLEEVAEMTKQSSDYFNHIGG